VDFKRETDKFLDAVGESVTVRVYDEELNVKALVQPMRYKNKLYLENERNELGFKDGECFLYLGPAEVDFAGHENAVVISTADRKYNVSRADRISLKGTVQYIWAVLTPRIKDGGYNA
jgi:hypothetical protein